MFLLVPGCPGPKAVKQLCVCVVSVVSIVASTAYRQLMSCDLSSCINVVLLVLSYMPIQKNDEHQ